MSLDGKTLKTQRAYLQRGAQLWQRAATESACSYEDLDPDNFLIWFEKLLQNLKPASRRQYIASVKFWVANLLSNNYPHTKFHYESLERALFSLNRMKSNQYSSLIDFKKLKKRTSSQKLKKISLAQLIKIHKSASAIKGKWIKPAMLWMMANLLVGLRPIEWYSARLEEKDMLIELVVQNAKNTHNRANGNIRRLNITGLEVHEIQLIKAQLKVAHPFCQNEAKWTLYYEGVRHTIKRIMRKYFKTQHKFPSLYSTRHQFAANAKSQGYSNVEVAALMGHATDETATFHYGKKKHGSGRCPVTVSLGEILSVRKKLTHKNHSFKTIQT